MQIFESIGSVKGDVSDFARLMPYLFSLRRDRELWPIFRSYLRGIPVCVFSEPLVWLQMLSASRNRFQTPLQKPHSFYVPYLKSAPFQSSDEVSRFLESNVDMIRKEFRQVAHREVVSPSISLVKRGDWNTFPLMRAAKCVEENTKLCPHTWNVAQQCPLLWGVRGGVYFSVLTPGTVIQSHCGPSNLKLRYHLTIDEAPGARIRSGVEWCTWRRDECLILDDSFNHEVVHSGNEKRVVLIVDCWHPGLNDKERVFLRGLHERWRKT